MTDDERAGLQHVYEALLEGVDMMPGSMSARALTPLIRDLGTALGERPLASDLARPPAPRSEHEQRETARSIWPALRQDRREALVLEVLGDRKLTVREITDGLNELLRTPECGGRPIVWTSNVQSLLYPMLDARQLERKAEPRGQRAVRYRYFRRTGLDGPIADLERAFNDNPKGD